MKYICWTIAFLFVCLFEILLMLACVLTIIPILIIGFDGDINILFAPIQRMFDIFEKMVTNDKNSLAVK